MGMSDAQYAQIMVRIGAIGLGIIVPFLQSIFFFCIIRKIWMNLYQCTRYRIQFSKTHNWIAEPSSSNKIYALLCPTVLLLCSISVCILYMIQILQCLPPGNAIISPTIIPYDMFQDALNGVNIISQFSNISYHLYLLSTIEYHRHLDDLMKIAISNKCILFVKCIIIINIIIFIINEIWWYMAHPYPQIMDNKHIIPMKFQQISHIFGTINTIIIQFSFIFMYLSGFNNVAHFWYSKCWMEYNEYGETHKIHELLIIMTRATVMVAMASLTALLRQCTSITLDNFKQYGADISNLRYSINIVAILAFIQAIFGCINIFTKNLAIYFIYDFGYNDYRKCCNYCHLKVYYWSKRRHQNQVRNGQFDGNLYKANNNNNNNCFVYWIYSYLYCQCFKYSNRKIRYD
eukprot:117522_1